MPKQAAAVDYAMCRLDSCGDSGVRVASLVCEHRSLIQQSLYKEPEIIPFKWCHACAKCIQACPLKAIGML